MNDIRYGSQAGNESNQLQLGFHAFPGLIELPAEQAARLARVGALSASVLQKTQALVVEALTGGDPKLQWLPTLMFGSIASEYRGLARELTLAVGQRCPVGFFRADVVGEGKIAELQCPGSGWAYTRALEAHYGIAAPNSPVLKAIAEWMGGRRATWWLHDAGHDRSVRYLIGECRRLGLRIELTNAETFRADKAELVIKRPPLPELIAHPEGRRLLLRWLEGNVELDLLPSMVPETKYLMVALWHPDIQHLFTEEERSLCPPTCAVISRTQVAMVERRYNMEEVFRRYPKDFILKYGGAEKDLRGGCHGVYKLDVGSLKLADREALLERAVADYARGEGWLLQRFNPLYWPVPRPRGPANYHAIFRPHYFRGREGPVRMVQATLNACSDWKVHAQSYAYLGVCR